MCPSVASDDFCEGAHIRPRTGFSADNRSPQQADPVNWISRVRCVEEERVRSPHLHRVLRCRMAPCFPSDSFRLCRRKTACSVLDSMRAVSLLKSKPFLHFAHCTLNRQHINSDEEPVSGVVSLRHRRRWTPSQEEFSASCSSKFRICECHVFNIFRRNKRSSSELLGSQHHYYDVLRCLAEAKARREPETLVSAPDRL